MAWVYFNGSIIPEEKASVPITDRGFLFGDGVFTTTLVKEGVPLHLQLHINRLMRDCAALNIVYPELNESIFQNILAKNKALKGTWRMKVLITGGNGPSLSLPLRDPGCVLRMLSDV